MATSNNSSVTLIARGNIRPNTIAIGGGKGGVSNYELLTHKPSINGHELIGNKTNADLGIPTDTQDLTNTAGFITNLVNNLVNYYTKLEIDDIINQIKQTSFRIVDDLPLVGEPGVIYLILNSTPQSRNYYDEYIYIDNRWEKIGTTEIDLSGYVTDEELTQALRTYVTNDMLNEALSNYYNKADVNLLLADKADSADLAAVAISGSYNDLQNKPDIPDDLADLNEDSTHRIVTDAEKATWNNKSDFSGSYNDLTDKPTIPDELADLTDDATHRLVTDTEKQTWDNKSDFSGSYNDLTDKPDIPTVYNSTITIQKNNQNIDSFTLNQSSNKSINIDIPEKTSDIQNDSGFITNTVNNLANYYLKSETYTKTEVSNLINAAVSGRFQKVNALPAQGEANVIYLVPKATVLVDNVYDEYIWEDDSWELIGDTQIDLSGYVTDADLTAALQNYVTSATFNTTISNYYTKTEVGNLLADKVDKIDGKGLSTYDYDAAAKAIVDSTTANLATKVDKVDGKGLSSNDYTTVEKNKLTGISSNATKTESSEINGNIKIDNVETQVYNDTVLQNIVSTDETTIEGNPINFSTLSAQKSKSTILSLEPIQDLHGYDKPWVGGAGKNKLPMELSYIKSINTTGTWSGNTYSIYGITITVLVDNDNNVTGIETSAGTPTSVIDFRLYRWSSSMETMPFNTSSIYNLSGCPANGSNSTYKEDLIYYKEGSSYSLGADVGRSINLDFSNLVDSTELYIRIVLYTVSQAKKVYYPMLRLSTETDDTYEPYTNICPISGCSEIGILGCGKNLFNLKLKETKQGSSVNLTPLDNGGFKINGTSSAANVIVWNTELENGGTHDTQNNCKKILPNGTYTISATGKSGLAIQVRGSNSESGSDDTGIASASTTDTTFTIDDTFKYNHIRIQFAKDVTFNNEIYYPMIRVSTDSSNYEPYTKSTDITINLGQTVYGGRLDVEKGELVVEKGYKTLSSIASGSWNKSSYSGIPSGRAVYWAILEDCKYTGNNLNVNNVSAVYNSYEAGTSSYEFIATKTVFGIGLGASSNKSTICINVDSSISSTSAFVTWLATNEIEVVYPLSTPQTIQLTPQQVQLLKGINNISTTGTTITVTFKNGSVAHLDDVSDAQNKLQEDFNFKFDNIDSQIDDLYWTFGKVEYTTLSRHSYEQGDYLVWTLDPDLFFIVLQPIAIGDALIEGVNIDYIQISYILKWLENRVSSLLTIMTPPTGLGDYNLVAHRTLGGNVQYEWQMIPSDFDYSHIVTKAGTGVYKTSALDTGSGETIVYISTSNVTRFSICNNIAVGDAPTWGNSGLWLIPVPADANQIRIQLAPGSMLYPVMCSLYHFSQDPATTIKYRYWPDYSPAWFSQSVFTWDMDVIRAECGDVQYYWVAEVCKSGYGNIQPSEVATYMPAITYIKNST